MTGARRYGCFDRPPLARAYFVPVAPISIGTAVTGQGWVEIDNVLSKDCQYSRTANDPRCLGCKHNRGAYNLIKDQR